MPAWPHLITDSLGDHAGHLTWHLFAGAEHCEDCAYAPGFSEWRYRQVEPGMTLAEVRALLGEPLKLHAGGDGAWTARYSMSPGDTHFWCRNVSLDSDERVTGLSHQSCFD